MAIEGAAQAGASKQTPDGVKYGPYSQPGQHAGKTVAQVRAEMNKLWGVPDEAKAYDGKEVLADSHVLKPGQNIHFHRIMGEKG